MRTGEETVLTRPILSIALERRSPTEEPLDFSPYGVAAAFGLPAPSGGVAPRPVAS